VASIVATTDEAVAGIADGSTVLVGGFGLAGVPMDLINALVRRGSFPRQSDSYVFDRLFRAGKVELELVPQGNLAERIRAAGAGIGAFYSPTGVGTPLAEGKETRVFDGRTYLLEHPIKGDVALISAYKSDGLGNLVYRKTARNFGPIMATAAATVIAQVNEIVPIGALDPEAVITPSIYVDRVVQAAAREPRAYGVR